MYHASFPRGNGGPIRPGCGGLPGALPARPRRSLTSPASRAPAGRAGVRGCRRSPHGAMPPVAARSQLCGDWRQRLPAAAAGRARAHWLRSAAAGAMVRPGRAKRRPGPPMIDSKQQRINMVESQVRPSDVTDRRIIRAMLEVPREAFVPAALQALAYMDEAVPATEADGGRPGALPAGAAHVRQARAAGRDRAGRRGAGCRAAPRATPRPCWRASPRPSWRSRSTRRWPRAPRRRCASWASATPLVIEGALETGAPSHAPFDAILLEGAVPRSAPGAARAAQGRRPPGGRDRRRRLRPRPGVAAHGQALRSPPRLRCGRASRCPAFARQAEFVF